MRHEKLAVMALLALIHSSFMALSYDARLITFIAICDPIIVHRVLIIVQFLPLIAVLCRQKLLESKSLLFFTFAACVNTIYVIDDFHSGFYGAVLDNGSGLFPRMRMPAIFMAFRDTSRLIMLDPHASYFQEYMVVHLISEVVGINHILVYAYVMRQAFVILWSLAFVLACRCLKKPQPLWLLMLAGSVLLANYGYNYEIGSASLLFLLLYILIATKGSSPALKGCAMMLALGIALTSLPDTLLFASVSFVAVCVSLFMLLTPSISHRLSIKAHPYAITFVVLALARIFLFTVTDYIKSYSTMFLNLVKSVPEVLRIISEEVVERGEVMLREEPFTTFRAIRHPIDTMMAQLSVITLLGLMTMLVVLSFVSIKRWRDSDILSLAIPITYVSFFTVPVLGYTMLKVLASGPIRDFASAAIFVRTLGPMATLVASRSVNVKNTANKEVTKALTVFALVLLSLATIFAPFLWLRGSVKSCYDMLQVVGDGNEQTLLSNSAYNFIVSHVPPSATVGLSYKALMLQRFYYLPLEYKLGMQSVKYAIFEINPYSARVFHNGMHIVMHYDDLLVWAYG